MSKDIFKRLQSGETVPFNDPFYGQIHEAASHTTALLTEFSVSANIEKVRHIWGEISETPLHSSSTIQIPFYINTGAEANTYN